MKLHNDIINIERVGVETENSFTIRTTAKAFDILSSGLYTDPVAAIIRELSCNAYDSHTLADKSKIPFLIHLPNSLEPFLSIRDFGVGLSDADVLHLYTTYFESTKAESNDFIGALGLGSKSPFSYSKSYEVISRFDGVCRSYHMFINEHGIPDVVKMATNNTTDGNGLEVKIGVDPKDFNKFAATTASSLKHFDVHPTVVGVPLFKFDKLPTRIMSGDNWIAYDPSTCYYATKFTAIQGGVQYKVDVNQLHDNLTMDEREKFNHLHVIGYFGIGELEVAASREEIRYNTQTKKTITTFIRQMLGQVSRDVVARCNQSATLWDACVALTALSTDIFGSRFALRAVVDVADVNNPVLDQYITNGGTVTVSRHLKCHTIYSYETTNGYTNNRPYHRSRTPECVTPSDNILVLHNDVKVGGVGRAVAYANANSKFKHFILITERPHVFTDAEKSDISDCTMYPALEYATILDDLGNPPIHKLSEMCPPLPKSKITKPLHGFLYDTTTWRGYTKRVVWEKIDIDVDRGGVYFVIRNGHQPVARCGGANERDILWPADQVSANINHLLMFVNDNLPSGIAAYTRSDVIGIPITTWRKVKNNPNWIDAFAVMDDGLITVDKQITTIQRSDVTFGAFDIINGIRHQAIRDVIKTLPPSSPFVQATKTAVCDWDAMVSSISYYRFCANMHTNMRGKVDRKPYFRYTNFAAYPMFPIMKTLPTTSDEYASVVEYITLMDKNNKCLPT